MKHALLKTNHALKHGLGTDPDQTRALLREGRVLATCTHPNLVRVTDCLEIEGRPAIVMDYVDGPTLGDWLVEREPTPIDEALELFRGVVRGINRVHGAGIVHRDLKPENVLLQPRAVGGYFPRVCDFGMAKELRAPSGKPTLSEAFRLMGTPEYMAPEQIAEPGAVLPTADLYSLGVMLYELLCRVVPFDAERLRDVLRLVRAGRYIPASQMRPAVGLKLSRCIDRLLLPEPEGRPQTCVELLDELDAIVADR